MNKNSCTQRLTHAMAAALLTVAAGNSASAAPITLADTPLYVGTQVPPNVFFMVDDSGSMDWEVLTVNYWYYASYWDSDPSYQLRIDTGNWRTYASTGTCTGRDNYLYMYSNADQVYGINCTYATAELSPETHVRDWRARSSDFNVMYYDPSITYEPWEGFGDATFEQVRSNPQPGQPGYDDYKDLTGFVYEVWEDTHGYSGANPAGPGSATNTPNGEIDLWDKHVRYTVGPDSITREVFTHDPASVPAGTTCDLTDANDNPPYADCFATLVDVQVLTQDGEGRSLADAKKNIANWYQYHRKRSFVTKGAIAKVITNKPGFRYGLSLINRDDPDNNGVFVQMPDESTVDYLNHNSALLDDLFSYRWAGLGTPLPAGLNTAGRYYADQLSYDSPIVSEARGGACQKNFTILFTDGYWSGNVDLPGSNDKDGDGHSTTVADVAKHYYDTDLDTNLDNIVPSDAFDTAEHQHMVTFTVAFGVKGSLVDADGDGWPDLNPLSESADWGNPFSSDPEKIDDLWHAAYNSRGTFVSASTPAQVVSGLEAALASVEERTPSASSVAMNSGSISSNTLLYQARFTASTWSGELMAHAIVSEGADYGQIGSEVWDAADVLATQNWDTNRVILTYKPSTDTGIPFRWPANAGNPGATELDASQVLALNTNPDTGNDDGAGEARLRYLRGDRSCESGGAGSCTFDLNGDNSSDSSDKILRRREGVLGDIVNSAPVVVGKPSFPYPDNWGSGAPENSALYSGFKTSHSERTAVVYVGANDGMLHGFKAEGNGGGTELLAYVPSAVYDNLNRLTDDAYTHRFFVDGSPTYGDVFYDGAWHTVLVGGLNKGGQGVYALDVTDPTRFTESATDAASVVLWEFTDADDPDLGYTFGQPALVRMQNGKWAAVFGNGYNSSEADGAAGDGHAKLFIVFIGDGADGSWDNGDYIEIDTGSGDETTPNGIATVSPVDDDGDYVVDFIYAGDLQGNLWKFDVSGSNASQWDVAYKSGNTKLPLFTACSADSCSNLNRQPITTRPEVGASPDGRDLMVYFGTGKYLGSGDLTDSSVQSFYGIIDAGEPVSGRGDLLEQTIDAEITYTFSDDGSEASGDTLEYELRVTSDNALSDTHKGWYMDLRYPSNTLTGERMVSHPLLRNGRIIFATLTPTGAGCNPSGDGWLMELDARDGSRLGFSPFDLNNDRAFTTEDFVLGVDLDGDGQISADEKVPTSGKKSTGGIIPTPGVLVGGSEEVKYTPNTQGEIEVTRESPGPPGVGRQSWRQLR